MFIRDLKDGSVFRVDGGIPAEFKGGDIVNACERMDGSSCVGLTSVKISRAKNAPRGWQSPSYHYAATWDEKYSIFVIVEKEPVFPDWY
jgi:hypothetical protein